MKTVRRANEHRATGLEDDDLLDREYVPTADDQVCRFRVERAAGVSPEAAASRVASKSSNGTWAFLDAPGDLTDLGVHRHPGGTGAGAMSLRAATRLPSPAKRWSNEPSACGAGDRARTLGQRDAAVRTADGR